MTLVRVVLSVAMPIVALTVQPAPQPTPPTPVPSSYDQNNSFYYTNQNSFANNYTLDDQGLVFSG